MAQKQVVKEELSLGDLFTSLANETGTLVRQEMSLAQAELTQKATTIGQNVGSLIMGGAVAYASFLALLLAITVGLSYFIPLWLSALVVAIVVGAVGYMMISSALKALKNTNLKPLQTVETLKEDAQWLKNQVS